MYVQDLQITAEEEINAYEEIMHASSDLITSNVSINIGYPIISKYLNLKYNGKLPVVNAQCTALIDSFYCNPDGYIAPCRKAEGCLLTNDNYNNFFNNFKTFFEKACVLPERNCHDCEYDNICKSCPLKKATNKPLVCSLAQKRLNELYFNNKVFKCVETTVMLEKDKRYFAYMPLIKCKTEYSKEGYEIMRACEKGAKIQEIVDIVGLPEETIMSFIWQEYQKGKIEME